MSERRFLSVAAIVTGASIPGFIVIFSIWGSLGLSQSDGADPLKVAAFAAAHRALYAALPILGVIMHVAALALVLGLHRRLAPAAPAVASYGTACGIAWVFIDIVQNLMHYYAFLGPLPSDAVAASARAADAVWHAGHFAGGLWVLSTVITGASRFGRGYRALCLVSGTVFALHSFIFPLVPAYFGVEMVLVPLWAFGTAVAIGRGRFDVQAPSSGSAASSA